MRGLRRERSRELQLQLNGSALPTPDAARAERASGRRGCGCESYSKACNLYAVVCWPKGRGPSGCCTAVATASANTAVDDSSARALWIDELPFFVCVLGNYGHGLRGRM